MIKAVQKTQRKTEKTAGRYTETQRGSPSPVDDSVPHAGWSEQRLADRAERENSCIGDDEGRVTPHYWFLGTVLNLLRGGFEQGEWEAWLKTRKIDETRALRARQLAHVFRSPDELCGLSLRQALKLAAKKSDPPAGGLDPKFARRLRAMVKTLRATVAELKRIAPALADERARLLGPAQEADRLLTALCHVCAERPQATAASARCRSPAKRKPR